MLPPHFRQLPLFSMRVLVLTLTAFSALLQCSFPDHKFSDVNCFNGIDAGHNACADPVCAESVKCVPPIPAGWSGPVALWRGSGKDTPPSCIDSGFLSARYPLLYAGDDPSVTGSLCPGCSCSGTPSTATAHCETRVQFLRDSSCSSSNPQMIGPDDKPGYVVGTTCTKIDLDTAQFNPMLYSHDPAYVVDNSCLPLVSGQKSFPTPIWDLTLRACDMPQYGGCTSGMCMKRAGGVFDKSVCIYQEMDSAACPQEFSIPFVYYNSKDARDCSDCACVASGLVCQETSSVGDWASDTQCLGSSNIVPPTPGCGSYTGASSVNMKLSNASVAAAGTPMCTGQGSELVGSVTKGQAVTFCCVSLE